MNPIENEPPKIPVPQVPVELVQACITGNCVLYAGSGLSAQAGLPTWKPLVADMIMWATDQQLVDQSFSRSLQIGLEQGDLESVTESLLDRIGGARNGLYEFMKQTLLTGETPAAVHRTLSRIPFSSVLTTNLDDLLEEAFQEAKPAVRTPLETGELLNALSSRAFFILKLYGNLNSTNTIILSAAQYEEAVARNQVFSSFMNSLFYSQTIFFLGASLEGIDDYLRGIKFSETQPRQHYALVDVHASGPSWELKASTLRRKYGINVLPYTPTDGHPQVLQFANDLEAAVKQARSQVQPSAVLSPPKGALTRVSLFNIGPFDQLELKLDPGWNVLLGDNGVGKSNILKAIAVAICGWDARTYANRLIKSDSPSGVIELETDRGTKYRIELFRGNVDASVVCTPPVQPLEAEGWLAIGFPPSRLFTWEYRPQAAETQTARRPTPEDLLPLVQGIPDPRMDRLKNWLVNLDYWIKTAREKGENWERFENLRKDFFDVVRRLAVGTKVNYSGVEGSFEVKVETDDGKLPLEAISQGTAALLGWVGILMQRLYEAPDSTNPKERFALVLIDELDAHMHPAWQQALIPTLQEEFPKMQFVATTHSPFLAIGRRAGEIVRLSRNPRTGKVQAESVDHDTTNMGVANVLTSYLFGLESPLDYNLQKDLKLNRLLSVKPKLDEKDRDDLAAVEQRLANVEATMTPRDPLYLRFVEEMTRREQEPGVGGPVLTKEQQERQRKLTEEILKDLVPEKGDNQ